MKRSLLSIFFLSAMPTLTLADEATDFIKQEADKCTKAMLTAEPEGVARYSHPRLLEGIGGKDALVAAIKKAMDGMKAQGVTVEKATIGEPEKPVKVDTWQVSFVPQTLVLKINDNRIQKDSHLLGISEDEGKKWTFVDVGQMSEEQLAQVFPELKGKVKLPEKKKPVQLPAEKS